MIIIIFSLFMIVRTELTTSSMRIMDLWLGGFVCFLY